MFGLQPTQEGDINRTFGRLGDQTTLYLFRNSIAMEFLDHIPSSLPLTKDERVKESVGILALLDDNSHPDVLELQKKIDELNKECDNPETASRIALDFQESAAKISRGNSKRHIDTTELDTAVVGLVSAVELLTKVSDGSLGALLLQMSAASTRKSEYYKAFTTVCVEVLLFCGGVEKKHRAKAGKTTRAPAPQPPISLR